MKKSFVALVLFVVGVMANVVVAQSQPSADMGKHIKKGSAICYIVDG